LATDGRDTILSAMTHKNDRAEAEAILRQQRIVDVTHAFQKMGDVDRREVVRAIIPCIPPELFIELAAANKPRRLDYPSAEIYLRVTTKTEGFRVKACAKEPFTIAWIESRIAPGDVLYDIGANVGAYSLLAACRPGGGARVFSFEASYINLASLATNVAINGLGHLVTPVPVALSDRTEMDVFHLRGTEAGHARHVLGHEAPATDPSFVSQPVMVFRLDDFIEQFRVPLPHHVKLDVDGGELAVLRGATNTLASPGLKSALVEVETERSDDVVSVLAAAGLSLEQKILKPSKTGEHQVWYGLFVRKDGWVAGHTAGTGTAVERLLRP